MFCPNCKTEYDGGITACPACGETLVERKVYERNNKKRWLSAFGETSAKAAVTALFFVGVIPLLFASILLGNFIYINTLYSKDISYFQNGQHWYTSQMVNNAPLGVVTGIACFIFSVLAWKIICELLLIIFRAIEAYTRGNG